MATVTLKHALLCETVKTDPAGIRSILNIVGGVETSMPTSLRYALAVWVSSPGHEAFRVGMEVRDPFGAVIWRDNGEVLAPPDDEAAVSFTVGPFPVTEPGAYRVQLLIDGSKAWSRAVHIARRL